MKANLLAAAVMAAVGLMAGTLISAQESQGPGVKETIKEDSKKAGKAVAHSAKTVGKSVQHGAEKAKDAVTSKSDDSKPKD